MRIISGKYKGRKLFAPKGLQVRPTTDRVKESVFSILGDDVAGARVLDLFAGSGALGLEALSRGAAEAVFVDFHPASIEAIKRNLAAAGETHCRVIKMDPLKNLGPLKSVAPFHLIFMDPPYGQGMIAKTLSRPTWPHLVADQALAVVEHPVGEDPIPQGGGWELTRQRRYGQTVISFLAWSGINQSDEKEPASSLSAGGDHGLLAEEGEIEPIETD